MLNLKNMHTFNGGKEKKWYLMTCLYETLSQFLYIYIPYFETHISIIICTSH